MRNLICVLLAGILALAGAATPAFAEPGTSDQQAGAAAAEVADPITIQHISDLRFGRFGSPATASTIQINMDGTFTSTGDVTSTVGMPQPATGRGPAQFRIQQAGNFGGFVEIPNSIVISNGSSTMTVTNITGRLVVISGFFRWRVYRLDMGGTLQIDANQEPGYYLGDFEVTVTYT